MVGLDSDSVMGNAFFEIMRCQTYLKVHTVTISLQKSSSYRHVSTKHLSRQFTVVRAGMKYPPTSVFLVVRCAIENGANVL